MKKVRKKRELPVVWVKWFDASFQQGTYAPDELEPLIALETAGLLVREDKDSISLASDSYPADGTYRHVTHIPKINIIAKKVFKP